MIAPMVHRAEPGLDLEFERVVALPADAIWRAWTTPALILRWFTPAPWRTVECELDLRPGGRFYTLMRSPEGQEFPNEGCVLEVVDTAKLVWTNAVGPGFRPRPSTTETSPAHFAFTAAISLEREGPAVTRYRAVVIHGDAASCRQHAAMGFETGWAKALDQLVELMSGP